MKTNYNNKAQSLILKAIANEYFKMASSESTQREAKALEKQLRTIETLWGWTHGTL